MSDSDHHQVVVELVKPQDKREAELEALRKKQLAKSWQVDETTGGSQPVAMDSWFEQQRKQNKLIRLQQKDAADNLRKNKYMDASVGNIKDQIKQKEQEATEMLHNYRGQPEDFMSHQVKKYAKSENMNKNIVQQADVIATDPKQIVTDSKQKLDTVEGPLNSSTGQEGDESRQRSGSQGTNDWSVVSGNESNGSDSTAVNVDISEITGLLSNGPDAAAGVNYSNKTGYDTPSLSSYVDASAEIEKTGKQWTITNISVSFGLLMHEKEAPPVGIFSSPIQNDVVDNLLYKMRLIAEKSLEQSNSASVARQDESPLSIRIVKDASYHAPANRPGVQRNLVKATIPIKTEKDDLNAVSNAKVLVQSILRKSLSDLTSRS